MKEILEKIPMNINIMVKLLEITVPFNAMKELIVKKSYECK
jgi:hypothetical protein